MSDLYREHVHDRITDPEISAIEKYQAIVVGAPGFGALLRYELLTMLLGPLPGALGLVLRRLAYPSLLRRVGASPTFGRSITIRHPGKISIGDRVVLDERAVLDARGEGNDGIVLGDDVMVAQGVTFGCKGGAIRIGDRVGIGLGSTIHSIDSSHVEVGEDAVIAAYVYLVGGSHYRTDRLDVPITRQGLELRGGIRIGRGAWIGAGAKVLDGVTVGADAIVGAGAVVTEDVPARGIAIGVPARVVKIRGEPPVEPSGT